MGYTYLWAGTFSQPRVTDKHKKTVVIQTRTRRRALPVVAITGPGIGMKSFHRYYNEIDGIIKCALQLGPEGAMQPITEITRLMVKLYKSSKLAAESRKGFSELGDKHGKEVNMYEVLQKELYKTRKKRSLSQLYERQSCSP